MIKKSDSGISLGKVAAYCGVTRKTILRWVNDGVLESFTLPSGHNRVQREVLLDFLEENKMPVPEALQDKSRKTVLVVDDDPHIRKIIVELFKQHFDVSEAGNGIDACVSMGASPPDLLFLDNRMPYMDGTEVCKKIRQHAVLKKTKIVILSAHLENGDITALEGSVDKIITKPFKPSEIVDVALKLAYES